MGEKIFMNIRFERVSSKYQKNIFEWLQESHVQKFWDNTQAHKDDIVNFIEGRIWLLLSDEKEIARHPYGDVVDKNDPVFLGGGDLK